MTVLDKAAHKPPLPARLLRMRERIRVQMPRAIWIGRIGASICMLLSLVMIVGIGMAINGFLSRPSPPRLLGLVIGVFGLEILMALAFLTATAGILFSLHRLYPYYYCQMLSGIYHSDYALLLAGEDIQREMDALWKERALGIPLRPKLISMEQHLESSALLFESIYLYSRHQKWMGSVRRYRGASRQFSVEVLFRWGWVTGIMLVLLLLSFGFFIIHLSIIYTAVSPQYLVSSARIAAFLDTYFDTPAVDPASLPPPERKRRYIDRLLEPLRSVSPRIPF